MSKINRTEKAKEKTFYIIPEYDKNISPDEALKVYLCFHDYILKNDAIYIFYIKIKFI